MRTEAEAAGQPLEPAACAYHPAAISLGLWPGLLQDGASVPGPARRRGV
uniref:Guanylyl cyclase domain containing 1 n=1 Tax=Mus musculus TaxID=10090 RepID=D6RI82_MOUSE